MAASTRVEIYPTNRKRGVKIELKRGYESCNRGVNASAANEKGGVSECRKDVYIHQLPFRFAFFSVRSDEKLVGKASQSSSQTLIGSQKACSIDSFLQLRTKKDHVRSSLMISRCPEACFLALGMGSIAAALIGASACQYHTGELLALSTFYQF